MVFILYNFVMENRSFLSSPQEQFTYSNTVNKFPPRLLFKLNSTNLFYLVIHTNLVWIVVKTSIIMSPSISNLRKWSNPTCILKLYLVRLKGCVTVSSLVPSQRAQWESTGTLLICTQCSVYKHKKAKHGGAQALLFNLQHVAISKYKPLGSN